MSDVESDLDLLHRAQRGEFAAFEQLVGRHQRRVFAVARRITGADHDAEDVTQQTFLSVIEHMGDFREESSFSTWLLRIATNHALKLLRKRRTALAVRFEDAEETAVDLPHPNYIAPWRDPPDRLAERAEVRRLLDEALADLDEKYRVVFVLRDIEGLSVRETAAALDLTESNVKVRLLRARLQLRERLTRSLGDAAGRVYPSHEHE